MNMDIITNMIMTMITQTVNKNPNPYLYFYVNKLPLECKPTQETIRAVFSGEMTNSRRGLG
jgi:hypothetical protein